MDISLKKFRILTGRDVDPVSGSEAFADNLGVCTQGDDQIWCGEQVTGQCVEAAAEIKFWFTEPVMGVEEAGESI
ncbi:MAG TPA: hypothetical protein PK414_13010, partial [Anaerolineales bacterium]|nr:hypothetical protein [Anaerolineales bacterium]